jgi:hypothetical protein
MNTSREIPYDGKHVLIRKISEEGKAFMEARCRYGNRDICPICRERFVPSKTTAIHLIVSNQVGIPNRIVHDECLADKTDEYAWRIIAEDYKRAMQSWEEIKGWFPNMEGV